jgi:hypothetical protein
MSIKEPDEAGGMSSKADHGMKKRKYLAPEEVGRKGKLAHLAYSDDEKASRYDMPAAAESGPDYPYGCCLRFTDRELGKMGLDDTVDEGDMIDMRIFGTVTSVSKRSAGGARKTDVEIQITHATAENESTESPEEMGGC